MSKNTRLTKSKFKIALECPTQLYYHQNPDLFDNQSDDNPFLEALAKGGFQVGELAKYLFVNDPQTENITIDTLNSDQALRETQERLQNHYECVIAEAAFQFENCFVRVDILHKKGDTIKIYEVKSKSINNNPKFFKKNQNGFSSEWKAYLYDVAFQTYVVQQSLGNSVTLIPYLLLANKDGHADISGLNQRFSLYKDENDRSRVRINGNFTRNDLGSLDILKAVNVQDEVRWALTHPIDDPRVPPAFQGFPRYVKWLQERLLANESAVSVPGGYCKSCPFVSTEMSRCGRTRCLSAHTWSNGVFSGETLHAEPLIYELWMGGMGPGVSKVYDQGVPLLKDLDAELLASKNENAEAGAAFSKFQRRKMQIEAVQQQDFSHKFNREAYEEYRKQWKWPLNMIDFETNTVAIPFYAGMRPYQTIAFQFSHHLLHEDGRVEHVNDFLSFEAGKYPNLDFLEALKASLETNEGTIFRYSGHENTVLRHIYGELEVLNPPNKAELQQFIDRITQVRGERNALEKGSRNMVDLLELVKDCYYSPSMKGSNSLKQVLPSILADVPFLKEKYSKAGVYGRGKAMESRNFDDQVWLQESLGWDPYKTLPPLFSESEMQFFVKGEDLTDLANGSAAMMAHTLLQFSEVAEEKRLVYRESLLRYCELDTMAMVILVEGFEGMAATI